ncbi:MAG: UbiA family prenyltransferase [Clostridia bacterium]|nr:UbiA family prenyltransferase [Clostridia bacterium]
MELIKRIKTYSKLVMMSHTLFSLPFALLAMLIAAKGLPSFWKILWIAVALFGARNGANAQNRLIDRHIDKKNERTKNREIPAGKVSVKETVFLIVFFYALFVLAAFMLNTLCLILSPVAILLFSLYSYTKRYTYLCHYILGFICAGAPVGAWIAITGTIALTPFLIAAAVMFWVAGFDIIYALSDIEHDKKEGLYSIPSRFGYQKASLISSASHFLMVCFLISVTFFTELGWLYLSGIGICVILLVIEHILVLPSSESKMKFVSYTINQYISAVVLLFAVFDIFLI